MRLSARLHSTHPVIHTRVSWEGAKKGGKNELMTNAFGTDNVIYVPDEEALTIYDLYSWRVLRFSVHEFHALPRKVRMDDILRQSRGLLKDYLATPEGKAAPEETKLRLDGFLTDLITSGEVVGAELREAHWLTQFAAPQPLLFWLRLSDAPAESFFDEDYSSPPPGRDALCAIPLYGTVTLSCLGEVELAFPETGDDAAFALEMHRETACVVVALDAGVPLPIIHEYCGFRGASNRGCSVNYTARGELAPESIGCIPLHRIGASGFATLYFHLATKLTHQVSLRVRGERIRQATQRLETLGYQCRDEGPRHQLWYRQPAEDILHFYHDLPGKESEGMRLIPSFVLAAQAGGAHDPAARARLIAEIAGKKHSPR